MNRPPRNQSTNSISYLAFGLCCMVSYVLNAQEKAEDFFHGKVEPLLQAKCLQCHSHQAKKMEGGLTLDSKSGWKSGGDRGSAIVPGKPAKSLLITAVKYGDSDLKMPPKEKLTDQEIAILVEWVQRGAIDPREVSKPGSDPTNWWSLKKLIAPKVPGDGHPIDAFIRERIVAEGFQSTRKADRGTLARRLHVDLHGVLPLPKDISAFVKDEDPNAYDNLVNKLLASPRYGERWARHWLDVIHFADSHGCEHDVKRSNAWRFRDYVIQRLNEDVPWSRFIREQLAADVFYPDQPQLKAGLGFVAAGPLELSRAGTAPVTFDYLDRDDIVTQTMAAIVSTTANCARCHTHKFDPITQEDYYSLQAVFAGVGKGDLKYDVSADVAKKRKEMNELMAASKTLDAKVLLQPRYLGLVESWVAKRQQNPAEWKVLRPQVFLSAGGAKLTRLKDDSILASGTLPDEEIYTVTSSVVDLKHLFAIRLDVLTDASLPRGGPGRAENGNLHLSDVELHWFPDISGTPQKLKIARAAADFDQKGWTSAHAIDGDTQSGWAIHPRVNQSHYIIFELAQPIELIAGGRLAVSLKQSYPPKHIIGRFRLSVTDAKGAAAQVLSSDALRALKKSAKQRTKAEAVALAAIALKEYATQELASLPERATVYGISRSWSHGKKLPAPQSIKTVHLLRRGAFDKPVREVTAGALSVIQGLPARFKLANPKQEFLRRAALADWLAHRDNPLTWRSIVNRVWHYHFGRGLCDTPNDFGRMGGQPTHPELLDWLAVWFRDEAKGSLKELHRLILTSETWQQSSRGGNAKDSDNRLLWKMTRQRMDAEVFRDSVLNISGRLDLTMGGPGIEQFKKSKGQQLTPALDYSAYDWESPGAFRRSIYRVVWRGIPDPFMEALDFPDLGLLAPKRGFSVSALQSLSVYNDDFVLHASQWFAKRVQEECDGHGARVNRAVELAWLRSPSKTEHGAFSAYVKKHGLAAFCRVLLNSNEFVFVD